MSSEGDIRILLIRHAESVSNQKNRWEQANASKSDPLTVKGNLRHNLFGTNKINPFISD